MASISDDEENAAELQFGQEFISDVQYLTNDEVSCHIFSFSIYSD
jgi:hypothetical protein